MAVPKRKTTPSRKNIRRSGKAFGLINYYIYKDDSAIARKLPPTLKDVFAEVVKPNYFYKKS